MKSFLLLLSLTCSTVYAQHKKSDPFVSRQRDSLNTLPVRIYNHEIAKRYNLPSYYKHPDFGILPSDAPAGKNVVEDLSKRKADERYFIDIDNPLFFYIQKSVKPINFRRNGYLIAIDPTLKSVSSNLYRATNQPFPTELNIASQQSTIYTGSDYFSFNHYKLKVVKNDNSIEIYNADWSHYSIVNNECYIKEVFPGIDMRMKYLEAGVKSEFVIKQNLKVKRLYFIDELQLSTSLTLKLEESIINDQSKGHLLILDNNTHETQLEMKPARTHDNSGSRTSWFNPYHLNGNELEIVCDSLLLNSPQTVYPVTVDPLVTVGPISVGTTYLSGTARAPASCPNTITVNFPGGATPWDVSAYWNIYSNWCFGYYTGHGALSDDCWQSEVEVWLTTSCGGRSPSGTTNWTCSGCNSTGSWTPTVAYNSSGTQSLAQCYSASCSNQSISFTINIRRTNCNSYSNYDACTPVNRSYCQTLNNWRVTVQGRTMETLGETTTGNGTLSTTVNCGNSYTMNPSANYGIAPYTYSWSSGGSGTTKSVTPTIGGTETHTVTVTDACNTSRTASFDVASTCPLPVELTTFTGVAKDDKVFLTWSSSNEINSDYYLLEKSYDGFIFDLVTKVPAAGNSAGIRNYSFEDMSEQHNAIIYYRLKQYDSDGTFYYSEIIAVQTGTVAEKMICIPNPAKDEIRIFLPLENPETEVRIEIYTLQGSLSLTQNFSSEKILISNLNTLRSGSYIIRAYSTNGALIGNKIIIHE